MIFFSIVKKVPIIPPLFINNKFVTNFQEKAKIFSSFQTGRRGSLLHLTKVRITTKRNGSMNMI